MFCQSIASLRRCINAVPVRQYRGGFFYLASSILCESFKFVSIPEKYLVFFCQLFRRTGKIPICQNCCNVAMIERLSGKCLLHCFVPNIIRITFALYPISDSGLLCQYINSLIATSLCDFYIIKAIIAKQISAIVFEVVSLHCIIYWELWNFRLWFGNQFREYLRCKYNRFFLTAMLFLLRVIIIFWNNRGQLNHRYQFR